MTRSILLTLSFLFALSVSATETVATDTLLNASTASQISVVSNPSMVSITVQHVDGSTDNFFYQTGISSKTKANSENRMLYFDITDVSIIETGDKINISFTSDNNEPQEMKFDIPDPDNRYVKTYLGAKGSDFGITLSRSGATKWEVISGGLGIGLVNTIDKKPSFGSSMWSSAEITWAVVLGVRMTHGPHSLTTGLGLDWRNYTAKDRHYFHKDDEGQITLLPYDEEMSKRYSRIKVFSLQIPLLYGFSFGHNRNFGIKLGPVVNFNTGGSVKTEYTIGSNDYSVKSRHIHQRPVTVDGMFIVNYKAIGIYAKYAPMSVLKKSTGLDFNSFSTGVMLAF